MSLHFDKAVKESTKIINKVSDSKKHTYKYKGNPRMEVDIYDEMGRNIENLSSGEKQLHRLLSFFDAAKEISPSILIIDEPELHLNYSQMPYIKALVDGALLEGVQIVIATHSSFFIRGVHLSNLCLIKKDPYSYQLQLSKQDRYIKQYFIYPDLFFCRKIIAVESIADKIFYERTLGVLLNELNGKSLDSRNIEIVAGYGKTFMKTIHKLATNLKVDCMFITDLDLVLQKQDFNFLGNDFVNGINRLREKVVKLDINKSTKSMFSLSKNQKTDFYLLIKNIFKTKKLTEEDINKYEEKFKPLFDQYIYDNSTGFRHLLNLKNMKTITSIFRKKNVWLLNNGTIDSYINDTLKYKGKLSIDKLQLNYYPTSIREIKEFVSSDAIKEFKTLSLFISEWDS